VKGEVYQLMRYCNNLDTNVIFLKLILDIFILHFITAKPKISIEASFESSQSGPYLNFSCSASQFESPLTDVFWSYNNVE